MALCAIFNLFPLLTFYFHDHCKYLCRLEKKVVDPCTALQQLRIGPSKGNSDNFSPTHRKSMNYSNRIAKICKLSWRFEALANLITVPSNAHTQGKSKKYLKMQTDHWILCHFKKRLYINILWVWPLCMNTLKYELFTLNCSWVLWILKSNKWTQITLSYLIDFKLLAHVIEIQTRISPTCPSFLVT